ncbi:Tyrosine--tRNA ligase [Buchnera aphidicola (Pterocallis alni)]|uniref:tyrosine--tRNA ligase n=1 Tax=Buchnera aphidicola TaxID=9 RepID=UPI003463F97C
MIIDHVLKELKWRGFLDKVSNISNLKNIVTKSKIVLYCGFDPTGDSLHIGHLLPLLCLQWFQKYGHKIIILIGYATSLIGDPSFKNKKRVLELPSNLLCWSNNIENQIYKIFNKNSFLKPMILNNYHWFKNINVISFLRDIGQFFSVNKMISRKFVQNRINETEKGISFTEFSYNLLQSYDFLHLYKNYGVILQIGGSDQWGNITSGINLIHRMYKKQVFGFTMPLLLQSNGIKFGKTEKNQVIWLDSKKTSPYIFYQFWLNIDDEKIIIFLKLFTLIGVDQINEIKLCSKKNINNAKSILADQVTEIVHGKKKLYAAKRITEILFNGNIHDLQESDLLQLKLDGLPFIQVNGSEDLRQALVNSKLSSSRSDAYRLIISKAIRINNRNELNPNYVFHSIDKLFGKFTILGKGKKNYFLLCW